MSKTENFLASYEDYLKRLEGINATNKTAVMAALEEAGISTVMVRFDGEGDSGQIDEITAYRGSIEQAFPSVQVELQRLDFPSGKCTKHLLPLREAIEQLCYDCLSQKHGGWENNDGAFGEFTFVVKQRRIALEFNGRFSDYRTTAYAW